MAQHGYLGDGYGDHREIDPDRSDERERGWRDDEHRDRGFLFGEEERGHFRDQGHRDRDQGGFEQGRRSFSASPDDHYRSWRERHMAELDRYYEQYCREREQQFHHDFDTWRNQRQSGREPLQTGMTDTGLSGDPTGIKQSESELLLGADEIQDPMAAATLGTNSRSGRRGG